MNFTVDDLFDLAERSGASDLHIVSGMPPIFRIDGVMIQQATPPLLPEETEALCNSILLPEQKQRFIEQRELDVSHSLRSGGRARINMHWELGTAGLVGRIIPNEIPSLDYLEMPSVVRELMKLKQGLLLVTGPTGSGKSTSMAAMLEIINAEKQAHIITLEDPIEFVFKPKKSTIRQRQLGTDMLSFKEGLKRVVRQDPNIIMVGEMRDLETIGAALTLAETGHLVLATLHTASATQTINRVIDAFPPHQQNQVRMQLSFFLRGVISKLLLPRLGGGRVPVYEVMINTPAISNIIRDNRIGQIKNIIQTSADLGMITMQQAVENKMNAGFISAEDAQLSLASVEI